MKTLLLSILALASTLTAWSQRFDDEFDNRTLRIDYTFAGNVNKQEISVAKLNVMLPSAYVQDITSGIIRTMNGIVN